MDLLESLYINNRAPMYHRAYAVLRDRGLAEDAVHEAFVRISKCVHRFEAIDKPHERQYLCVAIARNMALNILRKRDNAPLPIDERLADAQADVPLRLDLAAAISALDEGLFHVVVFRLRYGFGTAETARLMGITQGAVRQRLNRARKILKRELECYVNG
jgi:RNA polymerase sigma-70 factor (ECF subfamily)